MRIAALTKSAELLSPDLHILTPDELRQLQMLLLEMTNDMAEVCAAHNIPWSLGGGSLLGAVRHKGFIPWDDDMDFTMFRADFERFKTVFPGNYADKYELKLPGDPGYLYHFPKIYRKNTIAQTIQSSGDIPECVSVDIFIMENVSDNKLVRTFHGILCTVLLMIISVMRMKRCKYNLLKYGAASKKLIAAVKIRSFFSVFLSFLSLEQWLQIGDHVFSLCKDPTTEYIVIPSGNGHFFGELFIKEKMCSVINVCFDGIFCYVPKDHDYYLTIRYGNDYMIIPSKNHQEKHAFIKFELFQMEGKQIDI